MGSRRTSRRQRLTSARLPTSRDRLSTGASGRPPPRLLTVLCRLQRHNADWGELRLYIAFCLAFRLAHKSRHLSNGVLFAQVCVDSVRIRLTRKLSNALNGVDLRPFRVGDIIELTAVDAGMLIAEGWAERSSSPINVATANDGEARRRAATRQRPRPPSR